MIISKLRGTGTLPWVLMYWYTGADVGYPYLSVQSDGSFWITAGTGVSAFGSQKFTAELQPVATVSTDESNDSSTTTKMLFDGSTLYQSTSGYLVDPDKSTVNVFKFVDGIQTNKVALTHAYGINTDYPKEIVKAPNGNIIVTARSSDSSRGLVYNITSELALNWGSSIWISPNGCYVYGTAIDDSNNVYIVGTYWTSGGVQEGFLIKYNSAGAVQWQKRAYIGANGVQGIDTVIADSSGNIYCVSRYKHDASTQFPAIFKYNSSGTLQWSKSFALEGVYGTFATIAHACLNSDGDELLVLGGSYTEYWIISRVSLSDGSHIASDKITSTNDISLVRIFANSNGVYLAGYTSGADENLIIRIPDLGAGYATHSVGDIDITHSEYTDSSPMLTGEVSHAAASLTLASYGSETTDPPSQTLTTTPKYNYAVG